LAKDYSERAFGGDFFETPYLDVHQGHGFAGAKTGRSTAQSHCGPRTISYFAQRAQPTVGAVLGQPAGHRRPGRDLLAQLICMAFAQRAVRPGMTAISGGGGYRGAARLCRQQDRPRRAASS
jgi:hypothetical protein